MLKLTVKQKQWLIAVHVLCGAIWFGTALCMIAISLKNINNNNSGDALYALNAMLQTLDDLIIIPSATASLLTGALLCWLTIWGFFKHYWVIAKWIGTVSLISIGTIWLEPWVNAITSISETERIQALTNPLYVFDAKGALIVGLIQTLSVAFIILISFLKPWGRRISNQEK